MYESTRHAMYSSCLCAYLMVHIIHLDLMIEELFHYISENTLLYYVKTYMCKGPFILRVIHRALAMITHRNEQLITRSINGP